MMTEEQKHQIASSRIHETLQGLIQDGILAPDPDHPSGMVTGFTCYASYLDGNGTPSWSLIYAPEQRSVTTAGHVFHMDTLLRNRLVEAFYEED